MHYLLDTDIVSNLLKKNSPHHNYLLTKLQTLSPKQVYMSEFTKCELYFGLGRIDNTKKTYKAQLTQAVKHFVSSINILGLHEDFSENYGHIRSALVNGGQDIGVMDCMIAALAISHQFTLVTHNLKHYQRIQKAIGKHALQLEDWLN